MNCLFVIFYENNKPGYSIGMPKKESTFIKSKLIDSVQYEEREQIEDADK